MGTLRRPPRASLAGLLCLLALCLVLPQAHAAPRLAAACADRFALWASSTTRADTLVVSGSNSTVGGEVRSNRDVKLSGSNNRFTGTITYAARFEDGGDANSYRALARAPAEPAPLGYRIADYRPGGAAAAAASQAGRYTRISGDLDVSEPTTLSGLYYVAGNAKLGASDVRGAFTIVAEGTIDVSGSMLRATPYADGLLLFAGKAEPGAAVIKLAGSKGDLRGVIYGPGGMVELSGSDSVYAGAIVGDTLALNGSSLSITFAPGYCPGGGPPPDDGQAYAPGEVVVKLFSAGDLAGLAGDYGLLPAPLDQFGSRPIFRLGLGDPAADPLALVGLLAADPRVEYAEPNFLAQDPESRRGRGSWVVGESAGGYADQWAPALIRLPAAHTVTRGKGITVAVLDTGVDPAHPALAGRLVPGFDFVDFDPFPWEEGSYGVDAGFGHGTHVAGLVALAAPEAQIMPVRVLDRDGVGNVWVLSEGLLFAAERGPDGIPMSGDEARVLNLSLGTLRPTRLLEDLVSELACAQREQDDDDDDDDDAADQGAAARCASGGAVVLAAAGNGGDGVPQYPAAENVPGSLAVGASTRLDLRADFSTVGPWVRLAAPGDQIVSTVPGGGYGTWSGTSMAAPLTAGVAALVRAASPGLSAPEVADRLVATGRPIPGPIERRLDAAAAVGAARAPETAALSEVYLPMILSVR